VHKLGELRSEHYNGGIPREIDVELNPLLELLILLAAAVIAVPLFQRFGLGPVLGFMAAGLAVGPWGLALIDEVDSIRQLAELGIVFLLFLIGIEMKPSCLWLMRHKVFGFGLAQVVLTTVALAALGRFGGLDSPIPVLLGAGFALSSTAFVLQLLTERSELSARHGRLTFAILLFQDLAVVPLLALVPLLEQGSRILGANIGLALLEAAAILATVILVGRRVLGPLFRIIAKSRNTEIFTATALLLVLSMALLMEESGLSMAMGAFIAGLLIADSEYRHQVVADIQPFRGLLLGLFFMSVGMSIDMGHLAGDLPMVLLWLVILLTVKGALIWPLARISGLDNRQAAAVALLLAQAGEFGFVIFGVAYHAGVLPDALFQRAIAVVALSMVVTPGLAWLADRQLASRRNRLTSHKPDVAEPEEAAQRPVLIAGFGRVGRRVAELLESAGIPYVAVDADADHVSRSRDRYAGVFYGDATRSDVLRAAGLDHASLAVVSVDDDQHSDRIVATIHRLAPDLPIHARARDREHSRKLVTLGASHIVSETLEASLQLAAAALEAAGHPHDEVATLVDRYRDDYSAHLTDSPSSDNEPSS